MPKMPASSNNEELDRVVMQYLSQETALQSDSLDVKAKLAQEQYKVFQLQDTEQTQKEQLNNLLGRDIDTPFRVEQVPAAAPEESELKIAQQTALSQRSEIKQAEITVKQAEYDRRLAKAQIHSGRRRGVPLFVSVQCRDSSQECGERRRRNKLGAVGLGPAQRRHQPKASGAGSIALPTHRHASESADGCEQQVSQAGRDPHADNRDASGAKGGNGEAAGSHREVRAEVGLLRDVLQQQAATASANSDYQQAILAFWAARADFEKSLGED